MLIQLTFQGTILLKKFEIKQMLPENQYASFSENSDVAKMENNDA